MTGIVALLGIGIAVAALNRKPSEKAPPTFKCEFDDGIPSENLVLLAQAIADPRTPIETLKALATTMEMAQFPKAAKCLRDAVAYREGK